MHLVGTKAGAAAFASAKPPPSAEWLCVFDANRRYSPPAKVDWQGDEDVDPLDVFGLDSDPPRPEPRPGGGIVAPGEDALRWQHGDESWTDRLRLSGFHPEWTSQLPPRLYHLARWIGSVMEQPAAIWWASASAMPHPGLLREILHRLDRDDTIPKPALHFWRCYLEAVHARQRDPHNHRLYEIGDRVRTDGWNNAVLRELEGIVMPVFEIGRALLASPTPPLGDWSEVDLRSVTEIKVTVAAWPDERLTPPREMLVPVVEILRRSLIRMAEMLRESTVVYWRTPTLHPTGEPGESISRGRKSGHFLRFQRLFNELVEQDAAAAQREVAIWDCGDPIFFAKLFLYAATLPKLIDAEQVAVRILAMPADVLWDSELARELLFALRFNWAAFRQRTRRKVERRIIAGPPRREDEKRRDHAVRRQAQASSWLRWLELNGRSLSPITSKKLQELKAADPRWSDDWAWNAAESLGSWGGVIHRVTDPQGLDAAPIADLLTLAESLSTEDHRQLRDYRPFDGVVATAPLKALSALRLVARRDEWPVRFWSSLISNFPESGNPRLSLLLAHSIARLPADMLVAVRYEVGDWVRKFAGGLIKHDRRIGLVAFDKIADRFMSAAPKTLRSGMGTATVGGVPKPESQYSINKAINGPGGDLAMTLLGLIGKPRKGRRMPAYIGTRLERLFKLPGDGGGHVASLVARQFGWLDYWFRDWARRLVPMFKIDHPLAEAMWHGLSADSNLLSDDAGALVKSALLRVIAGEPAWQLDEDSRKRIIQQMVNLTYPRAGTAVISFAEARRALMAVGDEERAEAITMLANSMHIKGMWSGLIEPFIARAWPRQLRFQGVASSRAFASLIEKAGDRFPEAVNLVMPYLRPIPHIDMFSYRLKKLDTEGQGYSARFPEHSLRVLEAVVGDEQQAAPWNLGELLETIASAAPALRQSDAWRRLKAIGQ